MRKFFNSSQIMYFIFSRNNSRLSFPQQRITHLSPGHFKYPLINFRVANSNALVLSPPKNSEAT
jgi:hypothetical protein